ncbi:DUF6894 family protein [Methylobacterium sp. sgz302541]|uniref:DUF6894 family protein n=1 Tax=unclassified Methylobacterium TaxID=2615210 RepID=UPI003D33C204
MPRFFIDLHDGANFVRDTVGFDLPDAAAARTRLVRIMSKIAQDLGPGDERQDYLAVVRDEARQVVFRARLSFEIEDVGRV